MAMDLIDPELRFDRMAEAMGVPSTRVERPEDLAPVLREAISHTGGPFLVDVVLESPCAQFVRCSTRWHWQALAAQLAARCRALQAQGARRGGGRSRVFDELVQADAGATGARCTRTFCVRSRRNAAGAGRVLHTGRSRVQPRCAWRRTCSSASAATCLATSGC